MSAGSGVPSPPLEVMIEFIGALEELVSVYDHIVPVLRGSVLMRHWFGERARPAADIDLEWFPLPGWTAQRHATPLMQARNLCLFAAGDHFNPPIVFDEILPVPGDGVNLWDYETPGIRCYTGWSWTDRRLTGQLQIDLASPANYDLPSIPTETIEFTRVSGEAAQVRAYTPEMLLAAKLSWIVRHVLCKPTLHAGDRLAFFGEPKDLFDAHLLVTENCCARNCFNKPCFRSSWRIVWTGISSMHFGVTIGSESATIPS